MRQAGETDRDGDVITCKHLRRSAARLLVALLVFSAGAVGCRSTTKDRKDAPATKPSARRAELTPEQRQKSLESFDHVWNTVRQKHWDPTLGGLDWDAVKAELRPRVEQARTTEEARHVMQEMIGRLKQSHFGIIPASVYSDVDAKSGGDDGTDAKKKGDGKIGADVRIIDGKANVTKVDPKLPAAGAGVKPGWEVLAIDGREIARLLERLRANLPDNHMLRTMLTASVAAQLTGPIGESAKVTFRDGRGKRVERTIEYARPSGTQANFGHLPTMYVDFEARKLAPGSVGYIAFKPFFDPEQVMTKFADAMREY